MNIDQLITLNNEARESHIIWKRIEETRIENGRGVDDHGSPEYHEKRINFYNENERVLIDYKKVKK